MAIRREEALLVVLFVFMTLASIASLLVAGKERSELYRECRQTNTVEACRELL